MIINSDSIDQFIQSLVTNGASPNTIRAYKSDLTGWANSSCALYECNLESLEYDMSTYLNFFRAKWSINTLNRKLACFRAYGQFLGNPNFLSKYKRPPKPPGIAHPIPEGIAGILKMIDVAKKPRHKAMVALNGLLGLRISEVRSIRPSNFDFTSMELKVIGKGYKTRVIPISDSILMYLLPRYIECLADNMLLVPSSDRATRRMFSELGKRAGLSKPVSTHDGRMTFGTVAYYNSGGDIRAVQSLLGHSSMNTTENYTFVDMDKMRKAAEIV